MRLKYLSSNEGVPGVDELFFCSSIMLIDESGERAIFSDYIRNYKVCDQCILWWVDSRGTDFIVRKL